MHCNICLHLQRRKRRKGNWSSLVQFKDAQYLTEYGTSKCPWPWQWSCKLQWNYSFNSTLVKGGSGSSCCSMDHLGAHFFFEDHPKELQITPTTTLPWGPFSCSPKVNIAQDKGAFLTQSHPLLPSCTLSHSCPSERHVGQSCLHLFRRWVNFKITGLKQFKTLFLGCMVERGPATQSWQKAKLSCSSATAPSGVLV